MESITRETKALERPSAFPQRPVTVDNLGRPTKPVTCKLRGCAREGCLEVAKLGSNRCPLHA